MNLNYKKKAKEMNILNKQNWASLAALMLFTSMFVSCGPSKAELAKAEQARIEQEKAKKIRDEIAREERKAEKFYWAKKDSLYKAYDCDIWNDEKLKQALENTRDYFANYSQKDRLVKEEDEIYRKIHKKYKEKINEVCKFYNIDTGFIKYLSHDILMGSFSKEPDVAHYGSEKQELIKKEINKILNEAKKEYEANRELLKKKYKDYYIFVDEKMLDVLYYDGLNYEAGMRPYISHDIDMTRKESFLVNETSSLYWRAVKYVKTTKEISVYDSNLKDEFFIDENAEYKLVEKGTNKWQVVKTAKNGVVSKTHVFSDKGVISEEINYPHELREDSYSFKATPGKNKGVKIKVKKIWISQKPKIENDLIVKNKEVEFLQTKLDSVANVIQSKEAAKIKADSVLNVLVNQRKEKLKNR